MPQKGGASARVIDFLAAVTAEVEMIAGEIVDLGDKLAACAVEESAGVPHADMQKFDLISQNAQAQARLLAAIVCNLSAGGSKDDESLRAAIGSVPFHRSRQRLLAALDGACGEGGEAEDLDDQETDWF